MSVFLLVLGLLLFVGLVIVHEMGHFIVARRNGVEAEEFGIGFPPRAWSRKIKSKKGDYLFSLNWLPIGGFVKLKGENESDKRKGSLGAASFGVKAKIMLAGVGMNLLLAFVFLTALAWIGMPQLVENQFTVKSDTSVVKHEVLIGTVTKDSPASKAGLLPRDRLIEFRGAPRSQDPGTQGGQTAGGAVEVAPIPSADVLPKLTRERAGQTIQVVYERNGERREAMVQLRTEEQAKGKSYLGIGPTEYKLTRSTWSAPVVAGGLIAQFTALTFQGLGTALGALFQGDAARASEQVAGPVGIVALLKDGSLLGIEFIMLIIAIISLTLAIMNVLPIPALDGGRLFMSGLSQLSKRYFKKEMSERMEERIVGASFLMLLFLIVLITIVDVRRIF